jgi:eukaryotic-like serine/threonine-protein kinase
LADRRTTRTYACMKDPESTTRPEGALPTMAPETDWSIEDGRDAAERHAPVEAEGRYNPVEPIGKGGMGTVDAVWDRYLAREVARKEVIAGASTDRFLREALVTAALEHPGIVPVHELGLSQQGRLYYTMRRVRGHTLKEALRRSQTLPERLALIDAFVDLCQAVAYAHRQGVIHRDIKPDNVMLGAFGETVLLDWGIAKVLADREGDELATRVRRLEGDSMATQAGSVLGTPAYMSPEQAMGSAEVDARADVWSLGVVLYEIITGNRPFKGVSAADVVRRVLTSDRATATAAAPHAPADLAAIAEKALATQPGDRYPDAALMAREVEAWRTGKVVGAYRYSPQERVLRFARKYRRMLVTVVVATAVLAAVLAWSSWRVVQERDRAFAERDRAQLAERELAVVLDEVERRSMATEARLQVSRGALGEAVALFRAATERRQHKLGGAAAELMNTLSLSPVPLVFPGERPAWSDGQGPAPEGRGPFFDPETGAAIPGLADAAMAVTGEHHIASEHRGELRLLDRATGALVASAADLPDTARRLWLVDGAILRATNVGVQRFDVSGTTLTPSWTLAGRPRPAGRGYAVSGLTLALLRETSGTDQASDYTTSGLFDVRDGSQIAPLWRDTETQPRGIAMTPDGKVLAVYSTDRITWWDLDTRTEQQAWPRGSRHLELSNALVVIEDKDLDLVVLNRADGRELGRSRACEASTWFGRRSSWTQMSVSPDQAWVAGACTDRTVHVFDLQAGGLDERLVLRNLANPTMGFAPDGSTLWVGSQKPNRVRLWALAELEHTTTLSATTDVAPTFAAFSSDSGSVAYADTALHVHTRDLGTGDGHTFTTEGGFVVDMAWSADASQLGVLRDKEWYGPSWRWEKGSDAPDVGAELFDLNGEVLWMWQSEDSANQRATGTRSLSFRADGQRFLHIDSEGALAMRGPGTGGIDASPQRVSIASLAPDGEALAWVSVRGDAPKLRGGGTDGKAHDLATDLPPRRLVWSADSSTLGVVSYSKVRGSVALYDRESWTQRGAFEVPSPADWAELGVSEDGRAVALGGSSVLTTWTRNDRGWTKRAWPITSGVTRMIFVDSVLVSGHDGGEVVTWSMKGERLATLKSHTGMVTALAASPDGRHLFTGGGDGRAYLHYRPPRDATHAWFDAGKASNLRVCPGTNRVVPVVPPPQADTVWAPPEACAPRAGVRSGG